MIQNNTHRGNIEDAATAVLNAFNGYPNKEALALLINSSYGTSFQPARTLADWEKVGNAFIGLTIVAVGTSLPELAASILAAFHKETEMAVGNIIGSNIFNALLIPGIAGIVNGQPMAAGSEILPAFLVMGAATLLFLGAAFLGRINRLAGVAALGLYIVTITIF